MFSSPKWNPNADLNDDQTIDVFYAVILAGHVGEHYPWARASVLSMIFSAPLAALSFRSPIHAGLK